MQRSLNKALKRETYRFKRRQTSFLPTSLNNLWAWYDVSTIETLFQDSAGTTPVTTNSDPIGYIADRSGNGRYVRQTGAISTRPTYTTGVQNGLAAASFDGGDYLDSLATVGSFPLTMLVVIKRTGTAGVQQGVISNNHSTNGGVRLWLTGSNTAQAYISTPVTGLVSGGVGAGVAAIIGGKFTGTDVFGILNGTINTTSHTAALATNIFSIGRLNVNQTTTPHNGSICEVLVYNRDLTDTEIGLLSTYLNSKWSVY